MNIIQKLLQKFGLQLRREPDWRLLFERHGIEQVIDVGANHGQFHDRMRNGGFTGGIVSFEPNPAIRLGGANWTIIRAAVSDFTGTAIMDFAGDDSGSHLTQAAGPNVLDIRSGRAPVRVLRLDSVLAVRPVTTFLKTDAEGHDLRAIRGAGALLMHVPFILSEVALERRYQHEPTIGEVIPEMRLLGFRPALFDRCAYDVGRSVETAVDVLWVRA